MWGGSLATRALWTHVREVSRVTHARRMLRPHLASGARPSAGQIAVVPRCSDRSAPADAYSGGMQVDLEDQPLQYVGIASLLATGFTYQEVIDAVRDGHLTAWETIGGAVMFAASEVRRLIRIVPRNAALAKIGMLMRAAAAATPAADADEDSAWMPLPAAARRFQVARRTLLHVVARGQVREQVTNLSSRRRRRLVHVGDIQLALRAAQQRPSTAQLYNEIQSRQGKRT